MAILFQNVTHYYEKPTSKKRTLPALENLNIKLLGSDKFVVVTGQTGSGKTTLLQHINGLLLPTSGFVTVNDLTLTNKRRKNPRLKTLRKNIGYVFQFPEYQLFAETVFKDIIYAPLNFKIKEKEARESVLKYAKLLGIEDILDQSPFNLSGGQMRRVAIAGILAYEPEILLLDEPTRGIDPLGGEELLAFFQELTEKHNKKIIMITHDMNELYRYADRVVVLKEGSIVFDGDKTDLFVNNDYEALKLDKPAILELIDFLNKKYHINIPYAHYSAEELALLYKGVK